MRIQQRDRRILNYFPKVRERSSALMNQSLLPKLLHTTLNQTLLSGLDVKRSLAFYLEKIAPAKSSHLFISFDTSTTASALLLQDRHLGMPDHISFWYNLTSSQCEGCVRVHSIWKRTSLTAEIVPISLSLEDMLSNCKFLTIRTTSQDLPLISVSFISCTLSANEIVWV